MNIKFKNRLKRILSSVMAAGMAMSLIPSVSFAAQSNEYVDPADVWIEANGRTSEFDINATVTTGTMFCPVCDMPTSNISYRVPEYTRTGETALNRGVYYSDGTCMDGKSKGNLDDGTPGVDAKYTGHHWTKSVCQNCGTINSVDGISAYSCGKDVYSLNPCDSNFFLDFDSTEYTPYSSTKHKTSLKKGKYCQFCKGTRETAAIDYENHNFDEMIDGELGNLEKYKVISGYNDSTFRPDEQITRAEFVTMCMRFYELDSKAAAAKKNIFNDVPKSHWASDYIYSAVGMGWINGYSDSTFKPNSNITRAEVVTIVNRTTLRTADKEFVKDNFTKLNRFTDVTDSSKWYFFEVNEAANTHKAATSDKAETWVK